MAQTAEAISFERVQNTLVPELVIDEFLTERIPDAVIFEVNKHLSVYFLFTLDEDVVVTNAHLSEWRKSKEEIAQIAGFNGGEVTPFVWEKVDSPINIYKYPEKSNDWICHVLTPGALIEHNFVKGTPTLIVVGKRTAFYTGSGETSSEDIIRKLVGNELYTSAIRFELKS